MTSAEGAPDACRTHVVATPQRQRRPQGGGSVGVTACGQVFARAVHERVEAKYVKLLGADAKQVSGIAGHDQLVRSWLLRVVKQASQQGEHSHDLIPCGRRRALRPSPPCIVHAPSGSIRRAEIIQIHANERMRVESITKR